MRICSQRSWRASAWKFGGRLVAALLVPVLVVDPISAVPFSTFFVTPTSTHAVSSPMLFQNQAVNVPNQLAREPLAVLDHPGRSRWFQGAWVALPMTLGVVSVGVGAGFLLHSVINSGHWVTAIFAALMGAGVLASTFISGNLPTPPPPPAPLDPTEVARRVKAQIIPHIPTDRQVLYARSEEEMLMMVEALYEMGIYDERRPYIVMVDEHGNPLHRIGNNSVLVDPNPRTDRKTPRERSYAAQQYTRFARTHDPEKIQIIGATKALPELNYPAIVDEGNIPNVLAKVLNDHRVPLYLYAVGEKNAHVIKEFLRGGLQVLYEVERAFSEGTPKVDKENYKKRKHEMLTQNMVPLVKKLIANLENPNGVTIFLKDEKAISGEIIEQTQDWVVLKRLDNFVSYSEKASNPEEAVSLDAYRAMTAEAQGNTNLIRIPRSNIEDIFLDKDQPFIVHVVNIGSPDLVGHAGNLLWSKEALELTDQDVIQPMLEAFTKLGVTALSTCDHGNIEVQIDPLGRSHKGHTTNPVGVSVRTPDGNLVPLANQKDGDLTQIMATLLQLINVPSPEGNNNETLLADPNYHLEKKKEGPQHVVLLIFDGFAPVPASDKLSPNNHAIMPNIQSVFNIDAGAGLIGRIFAHGRYVGTREPIGEDNVEMAAYIRKKSPREVFIPVEGQYWADIYTTDVESTVESLKTWQDGAHYQRYQEGQFKIHAVTSMDELADIVANNPFYQKKRFSKEGFKKGRLLLLFDEGQTGGSEQGHTAVGAGKMVLRPITIIDDMIRKGTFFDPQENKAVIEEIDRRLAQGWEFHIDAFLQEAGVHASMMHLYSWLELLKQRGVPSDRVFLHLATDGRDEAQDMGYFRLTELLDKRIEIGGGTPYGRIASITPRSNHERDPGLFGRIEIEYNIQTQGRIPSKLVFDIDDKGGEYDWANFSLERGREFIAYLRAAHWPIEREQGIERLRELPLAFERMVKELPGKIEKARADNETKQVEALEKLQSQIPAIAAILAEFAPEAEQSIAIATQRSQPDQAAIVRSDEVDFDALYRTDKRPVLVASNLDTLVNGQLKNDDPTKVNEGFDKLGASEIPLVFVSHNGRPLFLPDGTLKPGEKEKWSLLPLQERVEALFRARGLTKNVIVTDELSGPDAEALIKSLKPNDVLILGDYRFDPRSGSNNPAERLALAHDVAFGAGSVSSLFSLFINNDFASTHRDEKKKDPSTRLVDFATLLPSVIGPHLLHEKEVFDSVRSLSEHPAVVSLGGSKVGDKVEVMRNLLGKMQSGDTLILKGMLAFPFMVVQHEYGFANVELGGSGKNIDTKELDSAREMWKLAQSRGVTVILPIDHVIAHVSKPSELKPDTEFRDVDASAGVPDEWIALDIGPRTVELMGDAFLKAKFIFENGAPGMFEDLRSRNGTIKLYQSLAAAKRNGAKVIAGGGDTISGLELAGVRGQLDHESSAGGAALDYLGLPDGEDSPPVAALKRAADRTRREIPLLKMAALKPWQAQLAFWIPTLLLLILTGSSAPNDFTRIAELVAIPWIIYGVGEAVTAVALSKSVREAFFGTEAVSTPSRFNWWNPIELAHEYFGHTVLGIRSELLIRLLGPFLLVVALVHQAWVFLGELRHPFDPFGLQLSYAAAA